MQACEGHLPTGPTPAACLWQEEAVDEKLAEGFQVEGLEAAEKEAAGTHEST